MKLKLLSIILTICLLISLFTTTGFATTEIRSVVFRDVPVMFVQNQNVEYFVPANVDINRGYDYFWMIEKYDSENNLAGAYWPNSMDDMALRFYRMLAPEATAEDLALLKTAFGTAFDGNYMYVFIGAVMLNTGYAFTNELGIRMFLTDGSSQTFVQEDSAENDYTYIAYNMPELGDVNCDSLLNATDALVVLQNTVGKVEFNSIQSILADVDDTPGITASDSLQILQMTVGKITSFLKYQ